MISMITDKIGIGDSSDGRQVPTVFDAVLNVAVDLDIPATQGNFYRHKVGLLDGPGNDDGLLIASVLVLHAMNKRHNRILVHCHEGKSRSVMVVSAYVSIIGNMEFEKVLKDVMSVRGVDTYRPALYQQYINLLPTIKRLLDIK